MKQSNRESLERFRRVKDSRSASSGDNLFEVLRIIREEWDPHYNVNMYCDACKLQMIDYAFGRADNDKTDTIKVF
jgi:hypothetical protein